MLHYCTALVQKRTIKLNKHLHTLTLLICLSWSSINIGFAQCPEENLDAILNNIVVVDCGMDFPSEPLCPLDIISFSFNEDVLIPANAEVVWFKGDDNYTGGTDDEIIGTSTITANPSLVSPCDPCPALLGLMVDACSGGFLGQEPFNEFAVIGSGGGFNTADLTLDFSTTNNQDPPATDDITPNGNCRVTAPSATLLALSLIHISEPTRPY